MATVKNFIPLGQNVATLVEGNILTIQVDLSKESGLTGTTKSFSIATTGGNSTVPGYEGKGPIKLGVNVYRPNPDYVKPPRA